MSIHECDVMTKITLMASLNRAEAGSVANAFTVRWELSSYAQYKDHKMYLVLEPESQFFQIEDDEDNKVSTLLVSKNIRFKRDVRNAPGGMIALVPYDRMDIQEDAIGVRSFRYPIIHEIQDLPDNNVQFELLDARTLNPFTTPVSGVQAWVSIDLVFSLYIMKSKR